MSRVRIKKEKNNLLKENLDIKSLIPLILVLAIVPLIVLMKPISLKGISSETWRSTQSLDFFSYYKSNLFIVFSILLLILFLFRAKKLGIEHRNLVYYYPLSLYSIFVMISFLTSQYKDVSLFGYVERYEGTLVLLSYVLVAVVSMNLVNTEKTIKILLTAVLFSAAVISLIGMFQFIGFDFFKSNFGRVLIVPTKYAQLREKLQFSFPKHQVYSTLYNPNYIGSYIVLVCPILFGLFLYFKNIFSRIGVVIFLCAMAASLIGSGSKTGISVAIFSFVLFIVFFRKPIIKDIRLIAIMLGILFILGIIVNYTSKGFVFNNVISTTHKITEFLSTQKSVAGDKNKLRVEKIVSGKNLSIVTNKEAITIKIRDNKLEFTGINDQILDIKYNNDNSISFADSKYIDFKVFMSNDGKNNFITVGNYVIPFYITGDGFRIVGNQGKPQESVSAPKWGFEGEETLASGRGYIWSRTIPMLKNTIIKGYGADEYSIYFPQNDHAGKLTGLGNVNIIVDKPHNMYLQMGVNTGVISMFSFLFLIVMYFSSSVKLYFKSDLENFSRIMGVCIFIGVFSYSLAGIFNDSTVSVAPVFWSMLGMGIAINERNKIRLSNN